MADQREQLTLWHAPAPLAVESPRTLTERLSALGYAHRESATPGSREVVDPRGRVVFTGRAHEAWAWLADGRPEGGRRG